MRKYCLTDCAKRKLTALQEKLLAILFISAIVGSFGLVVMGVGFTIGYVAHTAGYFLKIEALDIGLQTILVMLLVSTVLYWIYHALQVIYKTLFNFTKNRIEGVPAKCKIFEECK